MGDSIDTAFGDAYAQILSIARARLAGERSPISTVTLANELYLSIRDRTNLQFPSKQHFLAYSSRAMRSLLVDMARERVAKKRAAELLPLTLASEVVDDGSSPEQLVALDEALERLGAADARLFRVAELRIIMGMELTDVALVLEVSERTVKRDWRRAKAFLYDAIGTSA
jgi:RNA polymerase sigma factor (TIGR02999 family)